MEQKISDAQDPRERDLVTHFQRASDEFRFSPERQKALRTGDYVVMPSSQYAAWGLDSHQDSEERKRVREKLSAMRQSIKVKIVDMPPSDGALQMITVEGAGIRKQIEASLMYNFWKPPHREIVWVTNDPGTANFHQETPYERRCNNKN